MSGHGAHPPKPNWPNNARVAVSFALALAPGYDPGFWRLMRLFDEARLGLTILADAGQLQRDPQAARAIAATGHDICACAIDPIDADTIRRTVADLTAFIGRRPLGWSSRDLATPDTRRLLTEAGGFLYDTDADDEDLPYWDPNQRTPHLILPTNPYTNDRSFAACATGVEFSRHLRDSFDYLYREAGPSAGMLPIVLDTSITGRPGNTEGLRSFIYHLRAHAGVWVCCHDKIARHWTTHHPPPASG